VSLVRILFTLVAAILLAALVFDAVPQMSGGGRPILFNMGLRGEVLEDYQGVVGIAHNSGNRITTTHRALNYGADIVEIDVVSVKGRLHAGHSSPAPIIGSSVFVGPTLSQAWNAAGDATAVKLDLKSSSGAFIRKLAEFLEERRDNRTVIVVSRDASSLRFIREQVPHVRVMLSLPTRSRLDSLLADPRLMSALDGVSVQRGLLNEETVAHLHQNRLTVFVWTVNDLATVNAMVAAGVDGIITDNLAILDLLSSEEQQEIRVARGRDIFPPSP
jgi:hypothetical protein